MGGTYTHIYTCLHERAPLVVTPTPGLVHEHLAYGSQPLYACVCVCDRGGAGHSGKLWVHTDGWNRRDDLAKLELVKNRGLARRVKPDLCDKDEDTPNVRASQHVHIYGRHAG